MWEPRWINTHKSPQTHPSLAKSCAWQQGATILVLDTLRPVFPDTSRLSHTHTQTLKALVEVMRLSVGSDEPGDSPKRPPPPEPDYNLSVILGMVVVEVGIVWECKVFNYSVRRWPQEPHTIVKPPLGNLVNRSLGASILACTIGHSYISEAAWGCWMLEKVKPYYWVIGKCFKSHWWMLASGKSFWWMLGRVNSLVDGGKD